MAVQNRFGNGKRTETPAPPPYQYAAYPKAKHHKSGTAMRVVRNAEEEAALGPEWGDAPVAPEGTDDGTGEQTGQCDTCVRLTMERADMQKRFDKAWALKTDEMDSLKARIETLEAQNEALTVELEKKHSGKKDGNKSGENKTSAA